MEEKTKNWEAKGIRALVSPTIRGIIKSANEEELRKEDIIAVLKEKDQFILLYFK